jgi:hypothetical protein
MLLMRFCSLNPVQQGLALRRQLVPVFARVAVLPTPSFSLVARKCAVLLKFQNVLLGGLAARSSLPLTERNTFLEAVACICERREWREYARGMYDESNFADMSSDTVLGGMVAAMERFREHERMSYHCVSIAMEYLSKKNFSGTAVEYCGRVLGIIPLFLTYISCGILLLSWRGNSVSTRTKRGYPIHSTIIRRSMRTRSIPRFILTYTFSPPSLPQTSPRSNLLYTSTLQRNPSYSSIPHNHSRQ